MRSRSLTPYEMRSFVMPLSELIDRAARRGSPRGRLHIHNPGQRRGLRLCSPGAEDEGSERIVTSLRRSSSAIYHRR